ncbi:hypothetical protein NUBL22006_32470 [Klebsiella pneumoniae]|nr:hypothetical protein NUBL22006_32470 [Klebsiella pneumoniae]
MSSAGYIPQIGLAIALILAAVNADSLSPAALTLARAYEIAGPAVPSRM